MRRRRDVLILGNYVVDFIRIRLIKNEGERERIERIVKAVGIENAVALIILR